MAAITNVKTPVLARGEIAETTLFPGRKRPMSRGELRRALAPAVASCLKATCLWDATAAVGDYRFVTFATDVTPKVHVYIQFWSEPWEPVLWEVSSGRSHAPTAKWLAGERAGRIEALGFAIGGKAENFRRQVDVRAAADATRIARAVVDICYDCFDYRGLRPVQAQMSYQSRGELELAYDSFTPEDLLKILIACGFRATAMDGDESAPVLCVSRRGIETTVMCLDRVEDRNLFQRAVLAADVDVPDSIAAAVATAARPVIDRVPDVIKMGTTLAFDGGVTVGWVMRRIQEWDQTMASSKRS